jgi:GNAT superfamily N-acetyltransferase
VDAKDNGAYGKSLNRRDRGESPPRSPRKAENLQIRLAGSRDAAIITDILHAAFLAYKPQYTDGGFAATAPDPQKIRARMREGPIWIALRARKAVGTVAAVRKGQSVYLRGMAVLPSARGSSTGLRLLEQVEQWTAAAGARRLFLSTTPFLHAAIRLYERSGFVRIDQGPEDLFGTPLFTMEKVLSPPE